MTAATTVRRTARTAGRKAARSDSVRRLARLGLAGRGLLYGTVAVLAVNVARGSHREADRQGALRAIGANPIGRLALVAVAFGFGGYALWRLIEATVRPGDKKLGGRVAAASKGLLYTAFFATTLSYAVTRHGHSANDQQRDWTGRVLGWPAGRWLVAAAGLAVVAGGLYNVWRAASGKYRKHLKENEFGDNLSPWISAVAVAGLLARGVAFSLVGFFLVQAAVTYDPDKSQGLDGALRKLAGAPYGRPLLLVVAAGLAAFGVWSLVEARYRRVLGR